jgi:hypothetical protein
VLIALNPRLLMLLHKLLFNGIEMALKSASLCIKIDLRGTKCTLAYGDFADVKSFKNVLNELR